MASLNYDCMYVSDCVCRSEHVYLSTFDLHTLIENSGADFGVCLRAQFAEICRHCALTLCMYSRVSVVVCRSEQKLFSELAGVVHRVSVGLLPKAEEPSCRRRGSSCSPTTISG